MTGNLTSKLLIASALLAGSLNAGVSYAIPSGATDSSGSLSGTVDFFLSGCNVSGANCALNIEIYDTETGEAIGQAISGVTFSLSGNTSSVGVTSGTITSDGMSGAVTVITSGGSTSTTNTTPSRWGETLNTNNYGTGSFEFSTLTGGQPNYLVVDSGSGTGSGFGSHTPSLVGPVYFQITGIAGLTTATDIGNVSILIGTNPDATESSLNCTANNGGSCTSGIIGANGSPATPEPFSFLLAGSGLIGLACMRRRDLHKVMISTK